MSTSGRKLLSALVVAGDIQEYLRLSLEPYLFKDSEAELFDYIEGHLGMYGKLPSPETIELHPTLGESLVQAPEPALFYLHDVEKRYLHNTLKATTAQAMTFLSEKNAEAAMEALAKTVTEMYQKKNRTHMFDFREAQEIIYDTYIQTKTMGDQVGLAFGWPTLDQMTGGLRGGDFTTFVGRPSAGKTFMLLAVALNAWRCGKTPLFVSMEMNRTIIAQRLAAMYSNKNLTTLLKAKMSSSMFKELMIDLTEAQDMKSPFWVVDGNLMTSVKDTLMLCKQLRPSSVFIDGAYLLRHENNRMSRGERMSENAEQLKQRLATDMDIPVVASYQFNRDGVKKGKTKDTDEAGLENIYGSDSMGQLSTVSLGLFEQETVETIKKRYVKILKGRNGEVGGFQINWDFYKMDFSESKEENTADMQFTG